MGLIMDRFCFSSSPWGFRFFRLDDYCRTLKGIGIDQLCLMAGLDFPQALKGSPDNAQEYLDMVRTGVLPIEPSMFRQR